MASPIIISDANILIDFDEGGLLVELFGLNAVLAVPDIVYAEELEHLPNLRQEKLKILALGSAAVRDVSRLAQVYRRPSRNDLFALALALQEGCTLLTGDADLRDGEYASRVNVRSRAASA